MCAVCSFLLGKHRDALEVYEEAQAVGSDDWEVFHNMGVCRMYLKEYDKAAEMLQMANAMERHDTTYIQLGKVHALQSLQPFSGLHCAVLNSSLAGLQFTADA